MDSKIVQNLMQGFLFLTSNYLYIACHPTHFLLYKQIHSKKIIHLSTLRDIQKQPNYTLVLRKKKVILNIHVINSHYC